MNRQEIVQQIAQIKEWNECVEKDIALKALYTMLRSRGNQVEYLDKVFLEIDQMKLPTDTDKLWHMIFHKWLEYDDNNFFDGTRRICLICGLTETTPMKRMYGYETSSHLHGLNLENLLKFIKDFHEGIYVIRKNDNE